MGESTCRSNSSCADLQCKFSACLDPSDILHCSGCDSDALAAEYRGMEKDQNH